MKFGVAIVDLVRDALRRPVKYLRAVIDYPHVTLWPGAEIGPNCSFGRKVSVYKNAVIANSRIGDHSYVGGGSRLTRCAIGKFCSIGVEVQIGLGKHPIEMISTYPGFYSTHASGATKFVTESVFVETSEVVVGNDIWIGNRAIVLDGVKIGDGAIIAAGAIVTRNVPPYAVVAGVPARIIRMRFDERKVAFLLSFCWWNRDDAFLKEHAVLFADAERFFREFGGLS